ASLQNELQSNIYKNAKLKTQLFKKVYDQKDNTLVTSENTKFAKQPIVENLPKVGNTNALSNPVTSNSVSTPQESKSVNNDKVIAPGMFRINPSKTSREEKHVPNLVSASAKTKPITVSQPHVITKKDVNSNVHFLRSKDEAPEVIIKFLKRITVLLQSPVIIIRTDNGTEFKNQMLKEYFDSVGISHQMSSVRTPQQNGVVE
nr:ribonuclease H-like domain-containing protein [Tanacetum cinerariifolium]